MKQSFAISVLEMFYIKYNKNMSAGFISPEEKTFLDLLSRCDSLHDFDGQRHRKHDIIKKKIDRAYTRDVILEKIEDLNREKFEKIIASIEDDKIKEDYKNIVEANGCGLVSTQSIAGLPAIIVERLKTSRYKDFEPRTVCFYEFYHPHFCRPSPNCPNGIRAMLTSPTIPACEIHSDKLKYGSYEEESGVTINEANEGNDYMQSLLSLLNCGQTAKPKKNRLATGIYDIKDIAARKTMFTDAVTKFFDCKKIKFLVDASSLSFKNIGVTGKLTGDKDVSRFCTQASFWDAATKSASELIVGIPIEARRDDPYERCVFSFDNIVLNGKKASEEVGEDDEKAGKDDDEESEDEGEEEEDENTAPESGYTVTLVRGSKEYTFDVKRLPRAVPLLSRRIEEVENIKGIKEKPYTNNDKKTINLTSQDFLDFKRTGDALQVISVKRLNKSVKTPSPNPSPTPSPPLPSTPSPPPPSTPFISAPTTGTPPFNSHTNDQQPPSPTSSVGSSPQGQQNVIATQQSVTSPPFLARAPSSTASSGGAGGAGDTKHVFVTVDHLAFLKARLNGVPTMFTFTRENQRLAYLYKPEPGNPGKYYSNLYTSLHKKAEEYITHFDNAQLNEYDTMIANSLCMSCAFDIPLAIAVENPQMNFMKQLPELRATFLDKYDKITYDDFRRIFLIYDKGKSTAPVEMKKSVTRKYRNLFKTLLDLQNIITTLRNKFTPYGDMDDKKAFHRIEAAIQLPVTVLNVLASTFLTELFNKTCIFFGHIKDGVAPAYAKIKETFPLPAEELPDLAKLQDRCMKLTAFLERYKELDHVFKNSEKTGLLHLCGMDIDMYNILFAKLNQIIGPFAYRNVKKEGQRDSKYDQNKDAGLKYMLIPAAPTTTSTTAPIPASRTIKSIYSVFGERLFKELLTPVYEVLGSISTTIINSLYIPPLGKDTAVIAADTNFHEDLYKLFQANLAKIKDQVVTMSGMSGGGVDDPPGPSGPSRPSTSSIGPGATTTRTAISDPAGTTTNDASSGSSRPVRIPDEIACAIDKNAEYLPEEAIGENTKNLLEDALQFWKPDIHKEEYVTFTMLTNPRLLLDANIGIIQGRFKEEYPTLPTSPTLMKRDFVEKDIIDILNKAKLNVERQGQIQDIIAYYNVLNQYPDDTPQAGGSRPTTLGWTLYDYHKKYFPLYAKTYY